MQFEWDPEKAAINLRKHGVCFEEAAMVFVDAYQTLGSCSIDVKALDLDFLTSGNLKFLMGVPGIAFLYVKPSVAEAMEPTLTGWGGRENPFAFDLKDLSWATAARRFDTGTPPIFEAFVARAGMDYLFEIGMGAIQPNLVMDLPNGLRVGLLGLMGETADSYAPTAPPVTFNHDYTYIQGMVDDLRDNEMVDLVILLSHGGVDLDGTGDDITRKIEIPTSEEINNYKANTEAAVGGGML